MIKQLFLLFICSSSVFAADCDAYKVLNMLRPGAEWTLSGNTYEGLNWLDQTQVKPTKQEMIEGYQQCMANNDALKQSLINDYNVIKSTSSTQSQKVQALLDFVIISGIVSKPK